MWAGPAWVCGWPSPPLVPQAITDAPSLSSMAGMMAWKEGLARLEPVRVAVVAREKAAAVLHQHAGVAGDTAEPKTW